MEINLWDLRQTSEGRGGKGDRYLQNYSKLRTNSLRVNMLCSASQRLNWEFSRKILLRLKVLWRSDKNHWDFRGDYHLTLMVVVTPTFVMGKFLTNFDLKLRKSPQVSCGIAANNFNTGVWLIIWENCFFSSFFQQSISHSNESPDTLNCIFYPVISPSNDYNFLQYQSVSSLSSLVNYSQS